MHNKPPIPWHLLILVLICIIALIAILQPGVLDRLRYHADSASWPSFFE